MNNGDENKWCKSVIETSYGRIYKCIHQANIDYTHEYFIPYDQRDLYFEIKRLEKEVCMWKQISENLVFFKFQQESEYNLSECHRR